MKKLILFLSLGIFLVSFVSSVCCEKSNNGAWCFDGENSECNSNFRSSPNDCEDTGFCIRGCCFDNTEGFCSIGSIEKECSDNGGIWDDNALCEISKCDEGCCILGEEQVFVTEKRCEFLGLLKGVKSYTDFSISEPLCREFSQSLGACVISETCSLETEEKCTLKEGVFYQGRLCSHPDLDTGCERQASVGCIYGKDEIYWFDSCENRENIYSANRGASWNNGNILSKENSCNPDSGNIDSENCGNCNKFFGSLCSSTGITEKSIQDGNYVCKNLGCDTDGDGIIDKQNGESWCEYDSYIGESKDFPGSTHWKRTCIDGKIETENCGDKRNLICAEKDADGFSIAQCRFNLGIACYGKTEEECLEIPDCRIQGVNVDDYFKFKACVPEYPFGFDLESGDNLENGKDICSIGTITCIVAYKKNKYFKDECVGNCDCRKIEFAEQMNDFCTSLGDCGGYVNIEEEYTKNFHIGGSKYKGGTKILDKIAEYISYLKKEIPDENIPKYLVSEEDVSYEGGNLIGEITEPNIERVGFWDSLKNSPQRYFNEVGYILGANVASMDIWTGGEGLAYLLGVGNIEEKNIKFTCMPWQPPLGGENCEKCQEDLTKPCSKYKCESLGQGCKLINDEYENPLCIDMYSDDTAPPIISHDEVFNGGYKFLNEQDNGVQIESDETCIPEFTLLNFSLETNEYAQCHADFKKTVPANYSEMAFLPITENQFTKEHNFEIRIPAIDYPCLDPDNLAIYVVCNDAAENFNINEYQIKFCIKQGQDLTPAKIVRTEPDDETYLAFGTNKNIMNIFLNEPADCRYSRDVFADYEDMKEMACSGEDKDCSLEYPCLSIVENLSLENVFYIKCKDLAGNLNTQNFIYTLYVTENKLKIDSISPSSGTLIEGKEEINLIVKTSGGVEGGVSSCSYKFTEYGWSDLFTETDSTEHKYTFTNLPEGEFTAIVECKDSAKNIAINETKFTIDLDKEEPEVVRVFNENGKLKVITDEKASCYYDFNNCNFNLDEKDYEFSMTTGFSTEHTTEWKSGATYYIKCKDLYDNVNAGCAVIAKSGDF